jgi:hypothetical protein
MQSRKEKTQKYREGIQKEKDELRMRRRKAG